MDVGTALANTSASMAGARGGVPLLHCLGRAALARPRGPVQVPSVGVSDHAEGDGLHLDKHARAPRTPASGLASLAGSHGHCRRDAGTPSFAVERGRGRGIEGLSLLARGAGNRGGGNL
jgi:hypothetical protein